MNTNIIHYKLIENERVGDAPFIGALISAIDCKYNCIECFNQRIKQLPTQTDTVENIIKNVKLNIFNKGIILAGLEWSLQIEEAILLADEAKKNNLMSMLYTGMDFKYMDNYTVKHFDYIKCGKYIKQYKTINHIEYGVVLASSNQHIYKNGIDY